MACYSLLEEKRDFLQPEIEVPMATIFDSLKLVIVHVDDFL